MSEITTCPDCAKALEKWHRLERRMASRGNFGIVPLPSTCPQHKHGAPIGQRTRAENLERKLNEATKALDWIKTRSQMEGTPDPFAEKIVAVADEALTYIRNT